MEEFHTLMISTFFFLLFFIGDHQTVCANNPNQRTKDNVGFRPTKLFVFGDSYSDTGNNPKSFASSWKTPYGNTFPGKPAGRYSDGRVFTDYIAKFMGIRSPLPYQWREYGENKLEDGVNFAHGGTGVFDTGNLQPNMSTQIGFLEGLIEQNVYTKTDLESSLALVTVCGNDYGAYTSSGGSDQNLPSFISHVVNQTGTNLKRIHDIGVPRVVVTSLQPIGCLPRETVFLSYQQCNESRNSASNFHNQLLQQVVAALNEGSEGVSFLILDLFTSFNTVLKNKGDFTGSVKFNTLLRPCCEATASDAFCGSLDEKGEKLYTLCDEPESTFFWDLLHPSQAGWRAIYLTLRSSLHRIFN